MWPSVVAPEDEPLPIGPDKEPLDSEGPQVFSIEEFLYVFWTIQGFLKFGFFLLEAFLGVQVFGLLSAGQGPSTFFVELFED